MVNSVVLKWLDGSQAFVLDGASIEMDNARSVEEIQIPSIEWNTWFDNQNVEGKWVINGKFIAADSDWNSTTCTGRPLDFLHYLRSTLNGMNSSTGEILTPASTYNGFQLEIHQVFGGVERTYLLYSKYSTKPVIALLDRLNLKFEGGTPGIVDYTITLVEVSDVINFARA